MKNSLRILNYFNYISFDNFWGAGYIRLSMPKLERATVNLGVSPESLEERAQLRAAKLALDKNADIEYVFGGQTLKITLEEAVIAYSPEMAEERIEDLNQALARDTEKFLKRVAWFESEVEEEKKYAKIASEIKLD